MNKKQTEISVWSEIFSNGKYKELPSLKWIVWDNKEVLEKILSIRIPLDDSHQRISQYNIETQKYITNITVHNSVDLKLTQYNKDTQEEQDYTPYSDPWYNVYSTLLCAYYESFKKRPILNYRDNDIESWNKESKNIPFRNEMFASYWAVSNYIHFYKLFHEDENWIHRIIPVSETKKKRTDDWFGIKWNDVILQFTDDFQGTATLRFHIEKELLNLFIQAYIDVNYRFSGHTTHLNLKKIADVIYAVLENPSFREDMPTEIRREELK